MKILGTIEVNKIPERTTKGRASFARQVLEQLSDGVAVVCEIEDDFDTRKTRAEILYQAAVKYGRRGMIGTRTDEQGKMYIFKIG